MSDTIDTANDCERESATSVLDAKLASVGEKLATFVHRIPEFPEGFLPTHEIENEVKNKKRRKTIKVMVPDKHKRYSQFFHLFWNWATNVISEDDLSGKKEIILNSMQRDPEARKRANSVWKGIVRYVGGSYLHNLDEKTQSQEEIRALVQCVPEALSYCCEESEYVGVFMLPVHSAMHRVVVLGQCYVLDEDYFVTENWSALSFVPMLLQEGMKQDFPMNAFGQTNHLFRASPDEEDMEDRCDRGGLFSFAVSIHGDCDVFDYRPVLVELVKLGRMNDDIDHYYIDHDDNDQVVSILESLKQLGIMKKEDIYEHKLIKEAAEGKQFDLLNWIVEWDPKSSLKGFFDTISDFRLSRPYHPLMHYYASQKYHLFIEILEITLRHYPQQLGLLFLEDSENNNATVISTAYKNVGKDMAWDDIEEELSKVDPSLKLLAFDEEANMFPFMVAAQGDSADLDLLYHLMRKDPEVWNTAS